MALTPASILADYTSGIGTQGATLKVDTNEKRVGIGTTNPQGTLQVGTAITMGSGIITAVGADFSGDVVFDSNVSIGGTLTYEDVTNVDSVGIITARSGIHVTGGSVGIGTDDPTVQLDIDNVGSGTTIRINADTSNSASLILAEDKATKWEFEGVNGDNNRFRLVNQTGDESLSVLQTGNIGIGTDNPTSKLHVLGDARVTGILTVGTASLTLNGTTGAITGGSLTNAEVAAISSEIADTAVDVFVYDTSKDSDGGAWRKRTSGTSWYNEPLNTATRGSRREFPAVAVIVAETAKVTIYDGDDPDLPMWMEFNSTAGRSFLGYQTNPSIDSVKALNASLVVGSSGELNEINFLRDNSFRLGSTASWYTANNISQRNVNFTSFTDTGLRSVSNGDYHVAMTVLPNAPIDDTTGLPVPTIAVGTDGGLSVIRDDGNVFDIVYSSNPKTVSVAFNSSGNLHFVQHDNDVQFVNVPVPSQDYSSGSAGPLLALTGGSAYHTGDNISGNTQSAILGVVVNDTLPNATSGPSGLTFISNETPTGYLQGAVSYATTSYNTGWMHGDIKGAFLSGISTADVTGSELVTNGTFTGNINDWTVTNSAWAYSSDRAASSTSGDIYQNITTVVGEQYIVSVNFIANSSPYTRVVIDDTDVAISATTTGVLFATFTATSTSTKVAIRSYSSGAIIDDVSVRIAEEDRSVNDKGLQVFGTITKSPVAGSGDTAADLVGYSGFSGSNYLEQPYNSDLDFGSGSLSVMGWFKTNTSSGDGTIVYRGTSDSDETFRVYTDITNYGIYFDYGVGNQYSYLTNTSDRTAVYNQQWNHFVCHATAGGEVKIYVNGISKNVTINDTPPSTFSSTSTNVLHIGTNYNNLLPFPGSIALLRVSATVPSTEQIKKIYEDEKVLFQESSKCTLYGSSDAVTALAYDTDKDILHVGTSSGRSDFQGLHRINNTTTGIGTAISVSKGFIAEQ